MPNPNPQHTPTDGLGVAAYVQVSGTNVGNTGTQSGQGNGATPSSNHPVAQYYLPMSLSSAGSLHSTTQLTTLLKDVANTTYTPLAPGSALVLTAAGNASGGNTAYTGTITGGGSNAFVGLKFTIAGFTTSANNGTFVCVASTTTILTLANTSGASETHAGTATPAVVGVVVYKSYNNPSAGTPAWYNPSNFSGYNPNVASVSSSGLITAVAVGMATIEIQFATFDNLLGIDTPTGNPKNMIYAQVTVQVEP